MKPNFGLRSALAAIGVLCVSSLAMADSEQTTRPVIRGTGNDVTIVYQSKLQPKAPTKFSPNAPAPAPPAQPAADDPLQQAVKMKSSGASDQTVIAFLQRNEVDMPDVVDVDTIRDLRKAGAGDAVVALVSRYSAIDIGETAESAGAPTRGYYNPQEEAYTGAFPDIANLGYPFYGGGGYGYGSGYGGGMGWGHRFDHFGPKFAPHNKNVFFHFGPFFPRPRPLPVHFSQRMTTSRITGGTAGQAMAGHSGGGRRR